MTTLQPLNFQFTRQSSSYPDTTNRTEPLTILHTQEHNVIENVNITSRKLNANTCIKPGGLGIYNN